LLVIISFRPLAGIHLRTQYNLLCIDLFCNMLTSKIGS
ncbi:hypothetical protein ACN38_g12031, partial [Penicillium nordicum]